VGERALEWLQNSSYWEINEFDLTVEMEPIISQLKDMAEKLTDVKSHVYKANAVARRLAEMSIGLPDQGPTESLNSF